MTAVSIVVDTSVARQCGNITTCAESSVICRKSLTTIDGAGLSVVVSDSIRKEWRRHASRFAWQWLIDMVSRGRFVAVDQARHKEFRTAISKLSAKDQQAVNKDAFLVEAAIETHRRVLSRDDQMWRILKRMAKQVNDLSYVHWVNPREASSLPWLEAGAPEDVRLTLGFNPKSHDGDV